MLWAVSEGVVPWPHCGFPFAWLYSHPWWAALTPEESWINISPTKLINLKDHQLSGCLLGKDKAIWYLNGE